MRLESDAEAHGAGCFFCLTALAPHRVGDHAIPNAIGEQPPKKSLAASVDAYQVAGARPSRRQRVGNRLSDLLGRGCLLISLLGSRGEAFDCLAVEPKLIGAHGGFQLICGRVSLPSHRGLYGTGLCPPSHRLAPPPRRSARARSRQASAAAGVRTLLSAIPRHPPRGGPPQRSATHWRPIAMQPRIRCRLMRP